MQWDPKEHGRRLVRLVFFRARSVILLCTLHPQKKNCARLGRKPFQVELELVFPRSPEGVISVLFAGVFWHDEFKRE